MNKFRTILALVGYALATKGTIEDVEHIVLFMQENRAFDHYFGTMKGVRGYNDRASPNLPNGKTMWQQPYEKKWAPDHWCGCIPKEKPDGVCDWRWKRGGLQ